MLAIHGTFEHVRACCMVDCKQAGMQGSSLTLTVYAACWLINSKSQKSQCSLFGHSTCVVVVFQLAQNSLQLRFAAHSAIRQAAAAAAAEADHRYYTSVWES